VVPAFPIGDYVEVHLQLGDARTFVPRYFGGNIDGSAAGPGFNAIYFDPFSPETNPELWTESVFRQAADALAPGGSFTSYCVKSAVRRQLQAAGLKVTRLPGPLGGKREVLLALALPATSPSGS
ncbi:MAG: hypothetical protein KDA45_16575, partial [Planctomycetales bacterium]|nr:hypothetical protein [Planctomycetales bacterium]